jgi:hypothetical protein
MKEKPLFGLGKMQVYYECKECGKKQVILEKSTIYLFKRMFSIPLTEQVK